MHCKQWNSLSSQRRLLKSAWTNSPKLGHCNRLNSLLGSNRSYSHKQITCFQVNRTLEWTSFSLNRLRRSRTCSKVWATKQFSHNQCIVCTSSNHIYNHNQNNTSSCWIQAETILTTITVAIWCQIEGSIIQEIQVAPTLTQSTINRLHSRTTLPNQTTLEASLNRKACPICRLEYRQTFLRIYQEFKECSLACHWQIWFIMTTTHCSNNPTFNLSIFKKASVKYLETRGNESCLQSNSTD